MAVASEPGPRISLKERDRRYALIRERLKERGVDCVVVSGSNLFYLTNGLPGERYGLLAADEAPITVAIHGRHLADLSPQVLADAQDWVKNLRAGDDARPLIERIKELRLEQGTIGVTGSRSAASGLTHGFYAQLQAAFPQANLIDVSDIFADIRTIKSEEEIAMIDRANLLFDLAVERIHRVARPGMRGAQVVQEGIKAMWEAGGDLDSTVGFNFGPVPKQNPVLCALCMDRVIQPGDLGTLTAHSEYHRYSGHSDQVISFGDPKPFHKEMFDAVIHARDAVLKQVRPGATHGDLIDTYQKACRERGFQSSSHSQIHQYGIDVPEFPGPGFAVADPRGRGASGEGGRPNFVLHKGMIYSISPTLVGSDGEDTLLGGTSVVVTDDGYRELGDRKVELLVASG